MRFLPLVFVLCCSLSFASGQTTQQLRTTEYRNSSDQASHRKLFWGWVFLADLVHCPPIGKKHAECKNGGGSSSSGGSSTSSSSGGDGGDSDVDADSSNYVESKSDGSSQGSIGGGSTKGIQFAMLVAAAMAAGLAIGAVVLGQRRSTEGHPLKGSVVKRMALFGQFCNSQAFLCNRPPRHVESTLSQDDYEMMKEKSASV